MSYECPYHGWHHVYNPCPKCSFNWPATTNDTSELNYSNMQDALLLYQQQLEKQKNELTYHLGLALGALETVRINPDKFDKDGLKGVIDQIYEFMKRNIYEKK